MKHPIVLVTGVFDLLHSEHVRFLQKARALAGTLLIGVESDVRVKKMKGEGRPIQTEKIRMQGIQELQLADSVFVLPQRFDTIEDHRKLLAQLKPDIIAVSSHTAHQQEKKKLMAEIGGTVVSIHEHNPEISTTQLINTRNT